MIKILFIESSAIVRHGIAQIVQATSDIIIIAEAEGTDCAHTLAHSCEWDILLLDLPHSGKGGLVFVKEWRRTYPLCPILIFSLYPDEQFALRAYKAGAAGYLTVESTPEEVISAIRQVMRGERYITTQVAEKIVAELVGNDALRYRNLSDREYEVFCLLTTGKTVSEIAKQLTLSVKTVSTYRTRIMEKICLKNNAQIMHYAMTHGLTRIPFGSQASHSSTVL